MSKLASDDNLQHNFIDGWDSKQKPDYRTQDLQIDPEVKYLLKNQGTQIGQIFLSKSVI